MKKIKTIFERGWEGNKQILDKLVVPRTILESAVATEKLDGTNVRVTIRNEKVVRVEKRRNPTKLQKAQGIIEPWYVDTEQGSQDKYILEAVNSREYKNIPDGEWSGEVLGEKIQGNPLNLKGHTVCLFDNGEAPVFENVPTEYNELKEWLPKQRSQFGNDCGIEGIVWHCDNGERYKIKLKDFNK